MKSIVKKRRASARVEKERGENREAGIKISVSPITLIMSVYFVAMGMAYEFACSLCAVIVHEYAHAFVAKKLGYALNEIKLMPYGAALCGDATIKPKHEIAIAAAGPIINFFLGLSFAALWWLVPSSYAFTYDFCTCNIYIGVFNLLPVYPMDGGRIVFALLAKPLGRGRAYKTMRIISALFGLAAIALFIVSIVYEPNLCLASVGLFMTVSAFIPDARARYYALFAAGNRRLRLVKPLETIRFAVDEGATLAELCALLDPDKYAVFEVYGSSLEKQGEIGEKELVDGVNRYGYSAFAAALLKK